MWFRCFFRCHKSPYKKLYRLYLPPSSDTKPKSTTYFTDCLWLASCQTNRAHRCAPRAWRNTVRFFLSAKRPCDVQSEIRPTNCSPEHTTFVLFARAHDREHTGGTEASEWPTLDGLQNFCCVRLFVLCGQNALCVCLCVCFDARKIVSGPGLIRHCVRVVSRFKQPPTRETWRDSWVWVTTFTQSPNPPHMPCRTRLARAFHLFRLRVCVTRARPLHASMRTVNKTQSHNNTTYARAI